MIRRDLLTLSAGAAAGIACSPFPYRLLGDSAIWTQNWAWMPRPPRGEPSTKSARCTLCPAACATSVRCTGPTPIAAAPRDHAAMCPAGFVAHHLPYHPLRLKQALHNGQPTQPEGALAAARNAASGGTVAVLDLLPGRTASLLHRYHLAALKGRYLAPPAIEGATAQAVSQLFDRPQPLAANLPAAKTVLSLSTPILDGWASPAHSVNRTYRLIQAEPRRSRTAGLADEWLAIQPGSETALLLGLTHLVLQQKKDTRATAALPLADAARLTGLPAAHIEALANTLLSQSPALVIADGDPSGGPLPHETRAAAAALNALLGLDAFRQSPAPAAPAAWAGVPESSLSDIPDDSIALLVIDDPQPGCSIPWSLIEPKLAPQAAIIALAWSQGPWTQHAQWILPVPTFLEAQADAPPAYDDPTPRFAVSPALLTPPKGAIHAADFLAHLAGDETPFADRIKERIHALNADEKAILENGAAWTASATPPAAGPPARLLPPTLTPERLIAAANRPNYSLQLAAYGWRAAAVSPMLGKLWQESDLRPAPRSAALHPETLHALNLAEGRPALLESPQGRLPIKVSADPTLPPGLVSLSAGPAFSQLCRVDASGSWIVPGSKVVPA